MAFPEKWSHLIVFLTTKYKLLLPAAFAFETSLLALDTNIRKEPPGETKKALRKIELEISSLL